MMQPYDSITNIGEWCESNGVAWAVAGSWSLLLQGVNLPEPPRDLDVMLGLKDMSDFYQDNLWIRQRVGESTGRSVVIADLYTVDLLPTISEFQRTTLERVKKIQWGDLVVSLVDPIDILLFKLGHEFHDERGANTCKSIVDWRYSQKPPRPDNTINLAGGDTGRYWSGPMIVYPR